MATSIFLARLIGPVALVVGLALLVNAAAYPRAWRTSSCAARR